MNIKRIITITVMCFTILSASGCSDYQSFEEKHDEEIESEETSIYELPVEEQLKTRGALDIYFENTEYIDKVSSVTNKNGDVITVYNCAQGFGVFISEQKEVCPATFGVGTYNFYSEYLDIEGEFTITEPGEYQTLEIDYETKTYKLYPGKKENVTSSESIIGN